MSAKPRCQLCGHPRRRIISATRQTEGKAGSLAPAVVRKKACDCACHREIASGSLPRPVDAPVGDSTLARVRVSDRLFRGRGGPLAVPATPLAPPLAPIPGGVARPRPVELVGFLGAPQLPAGVDRQGGTS